MVRIRLARRGRRKKPIYNIVVTDARAPRDGRFIEKIGVYNPHTSPSTIELKVDSAVDWLLKGAQPSDTARSLLSKMGVMLKKHLQVGIKKKAITYEIAQQRFEEWRSKYWGNNQFIIYEKGVKENPAETALRIEDLEAAAQQYEDQETSKKAEQTQAISPEVAVEPESKVEQTQAANSETVVEPESKALENQEDSSKAD